MMPAASPPAQVAIDCLPSLYVSLTTALNKAGFSSGQTEEIFSKYVSAECVLCGIRINGDDIAHIAVLEKSTATPDLKLDRLRQGYCARNGCDSYYYCIRFHDHLNVNWESIYDQVSVLPVAVQPAAEKVLAQTGSSVRTWLLVRLGAVMAVVLVLLLIWQVRYYGHLPLLQKLHKYTIDPVSVAPEAPR